MGKPWEERLRSRGREQPALFLLLINGLRIIFHTRREREAMPCDPRDVDPPPGPTPKPGGFDGLHRFALIRWNSIRMTRPRCSLYAASRPAKPGCHSFARDRRSGPPLRPNPRRRSTLPAPRTSSPRTRNRSQNRGDDCLPPAPSPVSMFARGSDDSSTALSNAAVEFRSPVGHTNPKAPDDLTFSCDIARAVSRSGRGRAEEVLRLGQNAGLLGLLRQPGGFEGVRLLVELLVAEHLPLPKGAHRIERRIHGCAADRALAFLSTGG